MSIITGDKQSIQLLRGLSQSNQGSLLSCTPDGDKVDLWFTDDGTGRQQWYITLVPGSQDLYYIKLHNGTSGGRVFLSCTPDGDKVDLWYNDDNTGRQRWQFIPLLSSNIPNSFLIKVSGGTSGGRVLLSCTPDGSKVDLWYNDDGTGRQHWQLQ